MFTEFDQDMAVRRLSELLKERGTPWTDHRIRRHVSTIASRNRIEISEAYECFEDFLLDNNPRPEKW
jgi:hypothetical protein